MISVFYINLVGKVVYTTEDIYPQLDLILPRAPFIKEGFWKDKDNQNSIFVDSADEEVFEISFRFDTEAWDKEFMERVVTFAKRNQFNFTIRQSVDFSPEKLTKQLIERNIKGWTVVKNPLEYLENQKKYFH
jgi:hypothetical protein